MKYSEVVSKIENYLEDYSYMTLKGVSIINFDDTQYSVRGTVQIENSFAELIGESFGFSEDADNLDSVLIKILVKIDCDASNHRNIIVSRKEQMGKWLDLCNKFELESKKEENKDVVVQAINAPKNIKFLAYPLGLTYQGDKDSYDRNARKSKKETSSNNPFYQKK